MKKVIKRMIKVNQLLLIIFVLFSLLISPYSTGAAQWVPPKAVAPDAIGLNIVETFFNTGQSISRLQAGHESFTDSEFKVRLCEQMGKFPCDGSISTAYSVYEVLPPCSQEIIEWCIESLSIYKKKDSVTAAPAKLIRSTDGPILNSDSKTGLPQGGTISLWKADGQFNSGKEDTYAVYAYIEGHTQPDGKFQFKNFQAMVLPYSEKIGTNYVKGSVSEFRAENGKLRIGINGAAQECAWTENGKCGLMEDFGIGARAKLSLRIGNSLTGWLMGRMTDPELEVKPISNSQNLLILDSEPAEVPKLYISVPRSKLTPELIEADPVLRQGITGVRNQLATSTSFEVAGAWAKLVDDKSAGLFTTWSISSTTNGIGSKCLSDVTKLLGVVSTNSMLYEGNAPNFIDGNLNYKVFGVHYNHDGSVFKGKYDLLMRSETARCLYGFSNAPLSASVSVTSSNGEIQTATNVLTENSGWLHVGAYGFTFSSPTISVKLLQGSELNNDPSTSTAPLVEMSNNKVAPTPLTIPKAPHKTSIFCVKGKVTKKITSLKPKCPAGYKKK